MRNAPYVHLRLDLILELCRAFPIEIVFCFFHAKSITCQRDEEIIPVSMSADFD